MKFQRKLILTYSLFITVILFIVGLIFFQSNIRFFKNNINSTYTLLNQGIIRQFDDLYAQMDFMLLNFLSEEDVKSVIENLSVIDHNNSEFMGSYTEALEVFRARLLTYSVIENYHSIFFMNTRGDFFSSNFADHAFFSISDANLQELPWIEALKNSNKVTISPYQDLWSDDIVFGLGRKITLGSGVGNYIAAQKPIAGLKKIVSIEEDQDIDILILRKNKEVFYNSPGLSAEEIEYLAGLDDFNNEFSRNPVTGNEEKYIYADSDFTGLRSILIVQQRILSSSSLRTGLLIFTGFLIISLVSLLYNIYSSRFLTSPLREITKIMDETELDKAPKSIGIDVHHDEVLDLSKAFYELVDRLKKANKREVQYTTAWLQARFDALQEQINPHFIFNTLTVISKRAFEIGDDDICETCDSLADMLRYSTSTTSRSARVSGEIELTQNYLLLMKKRLGKRLNYNFHIDDELLQLRVPKIVLHQLVENSLNHGFVNVKRDMEIDIHVSKVGSENWCFRVEDNGEGFDSEVLKNQEEQMRHIVEDPPEDHFEEGYQIGGMGLVSTFQRLFLYFDGHISWEIKSRPSKGCSVSFIMPVNGEPSV